MLGLLGLDHESVVAALSAVAAMPEGLTGVCAGVVDVSSDAGPSPPLVTARSWNVYFTQLQKLAGVW